MRILLDQPVTFRGHEITHVYYAHLSAVDVAQAEAAPQHRHVEIRGVLGGYKNGERL